MKIILFKQGWAMWKNGIGSRVKKLFHSMGFWYMTSDMQFVLEKKRIYSVTKDGKDNYS